MKYTIVVLFLTGILGFAQENETIKDSGIKISEIKNQYSMNDSIPKVNLKKAVANPLFSINNSEDLYEYIMIPTSEIKSLAIEKEPIVFRNQTYEGIIKFETKDKKAQLITLDKLIKKYTDLNPDQCIFAIDGKPLNVKLENTIAFENYILKIDIHELNALENNALKFVNLVTRTEENVKEANKIWIR